MISEGKGIDREAGGGALAQHGCDSVQVSHLPWPSVPRSGREVVGGWWIPQGSSAASVLWCEVPPPTEVSSDLTLVFLLVPPLDLATSTSISCEMNLKKEACPEGICHRRLQTCCYCRCWWPCSGGGREPRARWGLGRITSCRCRSW